MKEEEMEKEETYIEVVQAKLQPNKMLCWEETRKRRKKEQT